MRTLKENEFKDSKKRKKKVNKNNFLSIMSHYNRDLKESRFGIIIFTKNCNAVKRNRIKRIIKDFMRKNDQKIKRGEYIFLFNKKIKITLNKEFEETLYDFLRTNFIS